jgi:MFS family permease
MAAPPPRSALLIIFLVVVIDLLGFAIVLPLLPRIAKVYLADQPDMIVGLTIGLLFSSFSAMQFLFAPLWGRLSDRIGRRPVMLIGLAGSVVFYALFGYAAMISPENAQLAIALMFASRIGAGIAGATISTAAAAIADCTTPEQRKRGMALIGAAFGIGFTFGPLIAYVALLALPAQGHGAVGYVAAGLSLIAFLLGLRLLKETRVPGRPSERRGWLNLRDLITTLRMPDIGLLITTYFLATFAMANLESTLSLFTDAAYGYTDEQNALVFAFVGFALAFVQGGIYRPMAKRVGEVAFIRMGIALMLLGLGGLGALGIWATSATHSVAGSLAAFLTALAVAVAGFAFMNPSVSALVSRRAPADRQGEVLGVNQSASALGRILGPVVALTMFRMTANHALPYAVSSAMLLVVLMLTRRLEG